MSSENCATISILDQYYAGVRGLLEDLGVDLKDPRIHFAVLAGTHIMAEELNDANVSGKPIDTIGIGTLVIGSIIAARPVREIQ